MSSPASSWMMWTMSSTVIMPTSRPACIDHRGGDQRVFLEAERDLFLVHVDRDQRLLALHHVGDRDRRAACAGSTTAGRCRPAGAPDRRRRFPRNRWSVRRRRADNRSRRRRSNARAPRSGRAASGGRRIPRDRTALPRSRRDRRAPARAAPRAGRPRSMSSMIATASSVSSSAGDVGDLVRLERVDQVLADVIVHLGEHVGVEQVGERRGERARDPRAGSARTGRRCRPGGAARPARARASSSPASTASSTARTNSGFSRSSSSSWSATLSGSVRRPRAPDRSRSSSDLLRSRRRLSYRRGRLAAIAVCQRRTRRYLARSTIYQEHDHGRRPRTP